MTLESENLIAALQNVLSELELAPSPDRDEESFIELKRILAQRIQDLESHASTLPTVPCAQETTGHRLNREAQTQAGSCTQSESSGTANG